VITAGAGNTPRAALPKAFNRALQLTFAADDPDGLLHFEGRFQYAQGNEFGDGVFDTDIEGCRYQRLLALDPLNLRGVSIFGFLELLLPKH
jgi:hypothetical protein